MKQNNTLHCRIQTQNDSNQALCAPKKNFPKNDQENDFFLFYKFLNKST